MFSSIRVGSLLAFCFYIYTFGLVFGSKVFLITPAASLMNIMFFVIITLGSLFFVKDKHDIRDLSILFLLALFVISICIATIFYRNSEQIKDTFYAFHIVAIFLIVYTIIKNKLITRNQLFNFLYYLYLTLICASIVQFLGLIGFGIQLWHEELNLEHGIELVKGPFSNPNNLAIICLMFFCMLYWMAEQLSMRKKRVILVIVTAIILLLTLSRLAVLLFILFFYGYLLYQRKYKLFSFLLLVSIIFLIMFITVIFSLEPMKVEADSEFSFVARNVNRLIAIRDIASSSGNDSSGIRINSYLYFFSNLERATFPYGSGNYSNFYINTKFDSKLISLNPHSYIIEVILAYGAISGFLLLGLLSYMAITNIKNTRTDRYFIFFLSYFLLLTNIPSSVLRMPLIWLFLFLIFYFCMLESSEDEIKQPTLLTSD